MTTPESEPVFKPDDKAVIMTVGLPGDQGGDVLDALLLDLEMLKPAWLTLIASSQSMPNARRMLERAAFPADRREIIELASAHDMDEVFRAVNTTVHRLMLRDCQPNQIAINYTSGTKVMGAGAVLSAVYNRISELRYITGLGPGREGSAPRHRILSTKPEGVFAYQGLLTVRGMLLNLRFRSARDEIEKVEDCFLTENERDFRRALAQLAHAYGCWDNFQPGCFLEEYEQVRFTHDFLIPFRLAPEQLEVIRQIHAEVVTGRPGPHIITDLFNNAARRLSYGHTEDAMARLYRALEMMAQFVLQRDFSIDTNELDTRRIPPRDRVAFEAMRSLEDGHVKIGLRKAYDLLVILRHPVGLAFSENPVMRRFLGKRAETILAHGLQPESAADAQEYLDNTRLLFAIEIQDFDRLEKLLQFPWLNP